MSDRGSIWTSKFWQTLRGALGISAAMSTAYHPQSDGNTERVNRIMAREDILRHFVDPSQSNWAKLLPLVEFAINDSWQESVQAIPCVLNYGKRPHLPLDKLLRGEGRLDNPDCVTAEEPAQSILSAVKSAKAALHAARQR
jgi:transposase InsO family protein